MIWHIILFSDSDRIKAVDALKQLKLSQDPYAVQLTEEDLFEAPKEVLDLYEDLEDNVEAKNAQKIWTAPSEDLILECSIRWAFLDVSLSTFEQYSK